MTFALFAQSVVNALLLSGTLALVALGFSLVWGIMNVINIAHGAFIMIGAYIAYWLYQIYGIDPFVTIPFAMVTLFIIGYLVQLLIINNIIRASLLATFLLTFGLETIIVNLALYFWKGDFRSVTTSYSGAGLDVGPVKIAYVRLAALLISLALTYLLNLFMTRTKMGNAIRATGMDLDAARLTGVKIGQSYALTYAIGAALAGAAGVLLSLTFPITPTMGGDFTLRAFVIVVLGGLGNVVGVMLGAFLFAFVEVFGAIARPGLKDAIAFAVLVLVLVIRPSGILGKAFYQ